MIASNRFLIDIVLLGAVILLPWWLVTSLLIYTFFLFNNFYEIIFFGFVFDVLYGVDIGVFSVNRPIIFVIGLILYMILNKLKQYLRSYA